MGRCRYIARAGLIAKYAVSSEFRNLTRYHQLNIDDIKKYGDIMLDFVFRAAYDRIYQHLNYISWRDTINKAKNLAQQIRQEKARIREREEEKIKLFRKKISNSDQKDRANQIHESNNTQTPTQVAIQTRNKLTYHIGTDHMKYSREFVERLYSILDCEFDCEEDENSDATVSEVIDYILDTLRGDVEFGDVTDLIYNRYAAEKIRSGLTLEKAKLREETKK